MQDNYHKVGTNMLENSIGKLHSSFGLAGASTGLYDLSRAMDGTDYAHIIVVKHRDKEEYQGEYITVNQFD